MKTETEQFNIVTWVGVLYRIDDALRRLDVLLSSTPRSLGLTVKPLGLLVEAYYKVSVAETAIEDFIDCEWLSRFEEWSPASQIVIDRVPFCINWDMRYGARKGSANHLRLDEWSRIHTEICFVESRLQSILIFIRGSEWTTRSGRLAFGANRLAKALLLMDKAEMLFANIHAAFVHEKIYGPQPEEATHDRS